MVLLDLGPGPATPPWLPLLMVIVLLGLIGFLYWSMRRNLNRINFDENRPTAPTDTMRVANPPADTAPDSPQSPLDRGSLP